MDIKEFAQKIGVSPTTISHAISGRGRVSDATRELVLQKMKEYGYTPNLNARRLVTGRSFLVALVHMDREFLAHIFTMELVRAFLAPLKARGYDLLLNVTAESTAEYSGLLERVDSRAVDGSIILGEAEIPGELLRELGRSYHPCVAISHYRVDSMPHVGSMVLGLRSGARQVAELLVKQGHTNIGFLGLDSADQMPRFFAEELQNLGIRLSDSNVMIEGHDAEDGAEGLRKMMSQPAPPTAVFARTDVLALGAIGEAKAMGIDVPGDLSVVGHDDLPLVSLMQPSLTTLRRDRMHIATSAVDMLFQLMEDPGAMVAERLIDSKLVLRQSAGPVK